MNGPAPADIVQFIAEGWQQRLSPLDQADVLAALDLDGDAAEAFMERFARQFGVDLTGYEAAFHHRESTGMRPGWPVTVQPRFGLRIPIAVSTLAQAAQTGHWPLRYPVLQPIRSRHWLNVPLVLIGLPLLVGVALAVLRLF